MVSSTSAVLPRRPLTITPASVIIVCVAALVSIGLAVLFSASSPIKGGPYYSYLYKQLIFLAAAIGAGWLVSFADLEQLRRFAWIAAAVALVMLVLVLIPLAESRLHAPAGLGIRQACARFLARALPRAQPEQAA